MKKNVIRMFLALSAACVSGSILNAQTHDLSANIPFAFQTGHTTLPAGQYRVGEYGVTGVLAMRNATTGTTTFIAGVTRSLDPVRPGRVVFHCYGTEACFLAEVWPVNGRGSVVPQTKAERDFAAGDRSREMASISIDLQRAD